VQGLTLPPPGGAGSVRLSGPTPDSRVARSPSFQCATTRVVASSWVSAARNPTRSASSRVGTSSPVASATARKAVQVAVAVSAATRHPRPWCRTPAAVAACVRILAPGADTPRRPENHPSSAQRGSVNKCISIGLPSPIATKRCISSRRAPPRMGIRTPADTLQPPACGDAIAPGGLTRTAQDVSRGTVSGGRSRRAGPGRAGSSRRAARCSRRSARAGRGGRRTA
jgi:hypothetical protein